MMRLPFNGVRPQQSHRLLPALAAALILFAAGPHLAEILRAFPLLPDCLFRQVTGFPCAACGTTRAALFLIEGSFAGAFAVQPFATAAFMIVAGAVIFPMKLSGDGRTVVRFLAFYLLLVNWLYLVEHGI